MKVRPTLLNRRQPKCYVGNGMLLKSGHWDVEFDYLEMAVIVKALSELGMLSPKYLEKLANHMEKEGITW